MTTSSEVVANIFQDPNTGNLGVSTHKDGIGTFTEVYKKSVTIPADIWHVLTLGAFSNAQELSEYIRKKVLGLSETRGEVTL